MKKEPSTQDMFPISIWGMDFESCWPLYRAAPRKPAVTYGGFKSRLKRYQKLNGQVDGAVVEQCLYEPPFAFNAGGVIYEIIQKSTGRRYIGITDDPDTRWKQHSKAAGAPRTRLHVEMREGGPDDFAYRIIAKGDFRRDVLLRLERALIAAEGTVWPAGLNSAGPTK